ncbi:MAG: hypothetical protein ACPGJV_04485 [Bacteriovoracaceae bacterium]
MKKLCFLICTAAFVLITGEVKCEEPSLEELYEKETKVQEKKLKEKRRKKRSKKSNLKDPRFIRVGLGFLNEYWGKVQVDDSGETNSLDLQVYLNTEVPFSFGKSFTFIPEFGITIPKSTHDGEGMTIIKYFTLAHLGFKVSNDVLIRIGSGFFFTYFSASGGTQTLANGTETTDFPLPNGTSTARNVILSQGIEWTLPVNQRTHPITVKIENFVFNLEDSDKRAISSVFNVNYGFAVDWF